MAKTFALVGQWGYVQTDPMGISSYAFDPDTGHIELIETICEDMVSGQMCIDQERGIAYIVDEIGHTKGDLGGGGYVSAFRIDPESGHLTLLNTRRTLSPEPCYLCLDISKRYLMICHCADPFHVTKIRQLPDGTWTSDTVYDDTALVLMRLNNDGSLGDICDVSITKGCGAFGPNSRTSIHPISGHIMHIQIISRHHSVACNPQGTLFAVCDRGMDRIYTYHLDRDNGKLIPLYTQEEKVASCPRYCAFHPTKPYFYANMEKIPMVCAYRYDDTTGILTKIGETKSVFRDEDAISGCSDLRMHPNGKLLYSTSNPRTISVYAIHEDGTLTLLQNQDCGGDYPRTICLSPDGRFLLSGNNHSASLTVFAVREDGTLSPTGQSYAGVSPSVIRFYTAT